MEGLLLPGEEGFTDPTLNYSYTRGEKGFSNPNEDTMDAHARRTDDESDFGWPKT